jgi:hydrogenase/urease accessory protein HupE
VIPPATGSPQADRRIGWAVALFLLAVYLFTAAFRFRSIDELAVFGVTRSLLGHGGVETDILFWRMAELGKSTVIVSGADGHYYGVKDLLPSLLGLPFVWLARLSDISPVRVVTLLTPVVTALTGALLHRLVRWWNYRRVSAVLAALLFGMATLAWPYAETFFTQSLAALGLVLAIYGTARAATEERPAVAALAGLGIGLGVGSALPTIITLPVYPAYILVLLFRRCGKFSRAFRRALPLWIAFGLTAGVILVLLGYYNWLRFGDPFQSAYQQGGALTRFSWRYVPTALFGLLLSTPRGLLWYVPLVSLAPVGLLVGWRHGRRGQLWLPLTQFILFFGLVSTYDEWWGGLAWGPRLLIPAMPALVIMTVPLLEALDRTRPRIPVILTSAVLSVSFLTQLLATVTENVRHAEGLLFPYFKAITPPIGRPLIPAFLVDPRWLPQARVVGLASRSEWDTLWLAGDRPDWPLFAALLGSLLLALVWLLAAGRKGPSSAGLAFQGFASLALAAWMVARYPAAPAEFQNGPGERAPEIDQLVAAARSVAAPGDGFVVLLPYAFLQWIDATILPVPDFGLPLENPLDPAAVRLLQTASSEHNRLWLVSEISPFDPADGVQPWLAGRGYVGDRAWFGNYRLESFTFPPSELRLGGLAQVFGADQFTLVGYAVERGDEWLNVWLRWQAVIGGNPDYTVTVQLLDSTGSLVAQHDGIPGGGFAPTSSWSAGRIVDDRHSITLTPAVAPGRYQLIVALYSSDGTRLPVPGGLNSAASLGLVDLSPSP